MWKELQTFLGTFGSKLTQFTKVLFNTVSSSYYDRSVTNFPKLLVVLNGSEIQNLKEIYSTSQLFSELCLPPTESKLDLFPSVLCLQNTFARSR